MYYYWWFVAMFLYLGILTIYGLLSALISGSGERSSGDTVFFAIASIVTLSVVPLIKENLYG